MSTRLKKNFSLPFLHFLAFFAWSMAPIATFCAEARENGDFNFASEDNLNLYCLREAYPQIEGFAFSTSGEKWLQLKDGRKILYSGAKNSGEIIGADIKSSMAQIYPLEPLRPDTPSGFAPGRQRSYALFNAIYGENSSEIKNNLIGVPFRGRRMRLSGPAANAFARAVPELEKLAMSNGEVRAYLIPEGGYYWRNIAGEKHLSPHSYGIALDIGVKKSPYWRWNSKMPHPLQKTYPAAIVEALEREGFIWGGKWHEYDLMHYEYRPELICKAKMLRDKK